MAELILIKLPLSPYAPVLALQEALVQQRKASLSADGYLILVEHSPPVITRGRRGGDRYLRASMDQLQRLGVELHNTRRGGEVTYHGPGQLVGYPIFDLTCRGRSVHGHIRGIEEYLIRLLDQFGIEGRRVEGMTGVWVGDEKIAAIGVAVRRWVTYHGFALNVSTNLSHFDLIVPCGISDRGVTSLSALLGRKIEVSEVIDPLIECIRVTCGFENVRDADPQEIPPEMRPLLRMK
jgi:lipoate-protein ligase B